MMSLGFSNFSLCLIFFFSFDLQNHITTFCQFFHRFHQLKMVNEQEKLERLITWLNTSPHTEISEKIELKRTVLGGRGLFAKEDMKAHQQIIKIAPSYLLNFTTVIAHIASWNDAIELPVTYKHLQVPPAKEQDRDEITSIYSKFALNDLLALNSFQIVSLFLILEKKRGQRSWWSYFIDMLPDSSDFVLSPLLWKLRGQTEIFNKLPQSTQNHANKMHSRFTNDHSAIINLLTLVSVTDVHSILTQEELIWAWMCVNSRCLYMEIPEGKTKDDNFTMAPFVDFINHSQTEECILKIDRSGFHVITTLEYAAESELFLSYGPHSNEFLLCEYGFTLQGNNWDDLDITKEIFELLSTEQTEFLKENDYYGEYTVNKEGISFRTEVALAVSQENVDLKTNRRLQAFLNGVSDGSYYRRKSNKIIEEIFKHLRKQFEQHLRLEYDDKPEIKIIGKLYRERLEIIEAFTNKS